MAGLKALAKETAIYGMSSIIGRFHVFRTWLVEKALSKEKRQAYVMFIQNGKAGYC